MSRVADYRCESCGTVVEVDLGEPPVGVLMMQHEDGAGGVCSGRLLRVWGPVGLLGVKGAGGSPPRSTGVRRGFLG